MSQEELQKKYDRLVDEVLAMRLSQKKYFKYRIGSDLDISRKREKRVDQLLADEVRLRESKQREIF